MTLRRAITNMSVLGFFGVLAPCLAFALNTPSGEPLEQVDATFLGTGQEAGPAAPAPGWAVQVGAFADEPAAEAQLTRAAERAPDEISRAIRRVTPFAWNDGRMFYRARFGGLDAQTAQAACAVLNRHGETCYVVVDQIAKPDHATLVEAAADPAPLVRHIESIGIRAPATVPVADIIVADTVVADTVVADTVVADTVVADTVVAAPVKVAANSARPSLLDTASQVNNDELSGMRGGFFTAAGAHFDFGASVQTMINGQLALQTNVQWTPAGPAIQQLSGLGASIQAQVASNLAKAGIGTAATNAAANAAGNAAANAANTVAGANAATANVASALTGMPPVTPNAATPVAPDVTAPVSTTVTTITPPTGAQPTPVTVGGLSGIQIPGATGGSTQVFANVGAGQIQNIILNSASNQTITQNTNVMLTIYNFPAWQQQLMQNAVSSQLAHDIMAASGLSGH
jgi:hypothetical protein